MHPDLASDGQELFRVLEELLRTARHQGRVPDMKRNLEFEQVCREVSRAFGREKDRAERLMRAEWIRDSE